jgi:hypothetical protein
MTNDTKKLIIGVLMIGSFILMLSVVLWFVTGGMYKRAAVSLLVWCIGQFALLQVCPE